MSKIVCIRAARRAKDFSDIEPELRRVELLEHERFYYTILAADWSVAPDSLHERELAERMRDVNRRMIEIRRMTIEELMASDIVKRLETERLIDRHEGGPTCH